MKPGRFFCASAASGRAGCCSFLTHEYQMVRKKLEILLDVKITDDALDGSIKDYNDCRQTMRTFGRVAAHHLDIITPTIRHLIIKAYYFMDVREYTAAVRKLTKLLRREKPDQYSGKKVIVTGLTLEPEGILGIFEQFGLSVVGDDLASRVQTISNRCALLWRSDSFFGEAVAGS